MKKWLCLFLILSFAFAGNCSDKLFTYANNMNKNERLSIKQFLDVLVTQKCNINVVIEDDVARNKLNQKMPFVRIKDYTLPQILDLILKKRGLFYSLNNNELDISFYKTKTYKLDFISSTRSGEAVLDATNSKLKNNYSFNFWDKLKGELINILKNNAPFDNNKIFTPVVNKDTGVIVVTGTMRQLKAVDSFMKNLMSAMKKEVLIDVKIYSVDLSESHKTGIDWSQLSFSLPDTSVPVSAKNIFGSSSVFKTAKFNVGALLNFLAQNGNVNSISNPKIMTLNNQKAIISVGDTIYYKYASKVVTDQNGNPQTQYTIGSKFVGVILDITPQISDNGEIILSISPRITSFKDLSQLNNATRDMPPDTKDNTMQSVIKIKNGDTVILGGLISNENSMQVNGVPILKGIPIIKYLFSSKEKITNKKEIVFVITPHIIDLNKKFSLKDLGFGKIK